MDYTKAYHSETKEIEPITLKYLFRSIIDLFDVDKGFLLTTHWLFKSPRTAVEHYFGKGRYLLSNPFRMMAVLVAVATFLAAKSELLLISGFSDGVATGLEVGEDDAMAFQEQFIGYMIEYFNLITFATLPLMAACTRLIFSKSGYNYAEHLVINTFVMAISTVLFIVFVGVGAVANFTWAFSFYSIVSILYQVYAYTHIFYKKLVTSLLKSIFATTLQYLLIFLVMMIVITIYFYFHPEYISS